MSRRSAREDAFKLVFERLVTGERNEATETEYLTDRPDGESEYMRGAIETIDADFAYLRHVIELYANGFVFGRIYKIDCAILLVAVYEILYTDVPPKAAVNEALELAKLYSTDKSVSFVNGVLASVIKNADALKIERETFGTDESVAEGGEEDDCGENH